MSNNRTNQDQPGLWDEPPSESARPREGRPRKTQSSRAPATTDGPVLRKVPGIRPSPDERPKAPTEVEVLWDVTKVSNYLGVPKQTIYAWRHTGKGPKGFRVGKHARWHARTVVDWTHRLEREQ